MLCAQPDSIKEFFQKLGEFQAVVEATASYEWFIRLIEPFADKVILAHPGKLRVIAESTRKSDKLDAQVLAEFLALDMVPTSYRPTPRQRDHRRLVRQRDGIQRRITSVNNRMRRIMSHYNADRSARQGRVRDDQGGRDELIVATTLFDLPAEQIVKLYEHRWQVELFFRFLKHVLNCN